MVKRVKDSLIKEFVRAISIEAEEHIRSITLFGSRAKSKHMPYSDYDIY